jgi:hypothetical protein
MPLPEDALQRAVGDVVVKTGQEEVHRPAQAPLALRHQARGQRRHPHWLGWTPRQRARRLGFVVNNSRFLVLPERQRLPNLASRVLGLCLRRLSADWQTQWGHPVLVLESFVDETRYRGTCYRACGFEAVGLTEGFGRSSRDFYYEHGVPKQLYLRELRPRARALLRCGRLLVDLAEHEEKITGPCPFRAGELGSLLDRFRVLRDARRGHGLRHRQPFVLACAAVATLMGRSGYQAFEDTCKSSPNASSGPWAASRTRTGTTPRRATPPSSAC